MNDYLQALDENDCHEDQCEHGSLFDASMLAENLEALQEKLKKKQAQLQHLQDSDEGQLSLTDPDARQLSKRGQSIAGYNVQIAVDEKHKLLVASEVTNDGNDTQQLYPISRQAKQVLQADALNVLADTGYWQGEQLRQCEQDNITAYVAVPDTSKQKHCDKLKRFSRNDFEYISQDNVYRCPAGNLLAPLSNLVKNKGKSYWRYMSKKKECDACPYQSKCLGAKERRKTLQRWEHEEVFDRARERSSSVEGKEQIRLRASLVEHPFGTLKRRAGWDHFLVRSFEKVKGEWSLMTLCYNFTRVLNIIGLDRFKKHCQEVKTA
ncbi:MAG: transposase [Amphritea sp.]